MANSASVLPIEMGDIVKFIDGDGLEYPAIVTQVWSQENGCCNLYVLPRSAGEVAELRNSVCYSETGEGFGWTEFDYQEPETPEPKMPELATAELISLPQPTSIYFSPVFNIGASSDLSDAVNAATQMFQAVLGAVRK